MSWKTLGNVNLWKYIVYFTKAYSRLCFYIAFEVSYGLIESFLYQHYDEKVR